MTNEEIADFISEKVMKWHRGMDNHWYDTNEDRICWARDWQPATNADQAMQAAEKIGEQLHTHIVLTVFPGQRRRGLRRECHLQQLGLDRWLLDEAENALHGQLFGG